MTENVSDALYLAGVCKNSGLADHIRGRKFLFWATINVVYMINRNETKNQKDNGTFTVTCYGKTKRYPESMRHALKHEYMMGMMSCGGSEKERYTNIRLDLESGAKVCSDDC